MRRVATNPTTSPLALVANPTQLRVGNSQRIGSPKHCTAAGLDLQATPFLPHLWAMGSMSRAAALLLLLRQARAGCDGNCAAPINVTCGSVLVVGDSTTAEYMPELRTLLSNLGVGHIYMANPASDGPCGSSFGLASCIEPYLEYAWSVIVLGWAHRDIKPNSYGVVTVSEYRTNLWETYTSLKGRLAPGGSMVFMTAVPVGASYEKRDNDDAKELNDEALRLFENEEITIIDHYARIVDACRRDPGLACYPETHATRAVPGGRRPVPVRGAGTRPSRSRTPSSHITCRRTWATTVRRP